MKANRMKHALESIARRGVPDDIDLRAHITSKIERKTFMLTLRARPVMAVLIALLCILLLGGVVYALGRSLGYIPGYGIVEQNVQMRILSEPVSQTRDGITITITEALLTSDRLFVTSTTENIPDNLIVPMSDFKTVTCKGNWIYQLPDGSQLSFVALGSNKMSTPLDVNKVTDMTLRIPCATSDVPVGALPENWEFHLRFIPAPAGMFEKFPVIEYTPVPVPTIPTGTPAAETNITATPALNPISITKLIDTGDSYILIGEIAPQGLVSEVPLTPGSLYSKYCKHGPSLTLQDANGQEISEESTADIDLGTPTANTPEAFSWARKFKKEGLALPLTIKYKDEHWCSASAGPYELNINNNPQPGDEWQVNQQFDVSGVPVTLDKMRVIGPQIATSGGGYIFQLTYPTDHGDLALDYIAVNGYLPINSGFGGGGSDTTVIPPGIAGYDLSEEFPVPPKGKLMIEFIYEVLASQQTWSLQWRP